jgi:hypothetical protein
MTYSSLTDMHTQFKTLMFHNRSEEQLQECLHLKKSMISLSAAIGALCSPLWLHLKSDLVTDLYSGSTSIANMDESDLRISFSLLDKSAISLSTMIGVSGSPLWPRPETDLATDLYSGSTLITIKDESNHQIRFWRLQEIYNITIRGWSMHRALLQELLRK